MLLISIHALLAESDCGPILTIIYLTLFLSTLSLRRATMHALKLANLVLFLSTLSLRRATHFVSAALASKEFLSTLSLRRATEPPGVIREPATDFYPRSPCGERRNILKTSQYSMYFYPRSPCGERRHKTAKLIININFYPRSPCGERQRANSLADTPPQISIHALLAESDATMPDFR